MSRALSPPSFPPGGAPVSVLIDYDGTISTRDVGDDLLARLYPYPAVAAAYDAEYDAGRIGSRDLLRWDMEVLPHDPGVLRATASSLPQDDTFPAFVAIVRAVGAAIEIVSDGMGFYVESNLARLDPSLASLPVATNSNPVAGPDGLSFPYGHPRCFVCGTCKRERVRLHQAAGRAVVFVGDGTSDRYAAHHADLVFAKGSLLRWGRATGRAVLAWGAFADVEAWFRAALRDGTLPARPEDGPAWRARHGSAADFICGPEVWGEGRTSPLSDPPVTG